MSARFNFDVIREFGCWRGEKHDYRLISLHHDAGLDPHMIQYGSATEDGFHAIDGHRFDEGSMDQPPLLWAHDWVKDLYHARRLMTYATTLRLYQRAFATHQLLVDGVRTLDHYFLLDAIVRDLNARAGFDLRPELPELKRVGVELDADTTTPFTLTPDTHVLVEHGTPGVGKTTLIPMTPEGD